MFEIVGHLMANATVRRLAVYFRTGRAAATRYIDGHHGIKKAGHSHRHNSRLVERLKQAVTRRHSEEAYWLNSHAPRALHNRRHHQLSLLSNTAVGEVVIAYCIEPLRRGGCR